MKKTVDIIFTCRPVEIKKPISWVNAITRMKTRSPFDHVSVEYKDYVYESVAGKGVHKIHWNDWVKGREGTYLISYEIPRHLVSFSKFQDLEGTGYDFMANVYYLFNKKEKLANKANNKMFCSELVAHMLGFKDPHLYTPDDLERKLREYDCYITEI